MWRHNDVIGWNEYLISIWPESAIPYVYSLQFLCKSTHHSWRYGWKCEWVFFLNSVYLVAFMKELVFQVWKSCFHLPMAILYTIHPRTLLMSPMHSLSLKMWILIYYMPYFWHFGSSYMCYCVDGGHPGRHLEFNPFCPVIQTVHPSFFYLPRGALRGSRVKMRGHLIAHRTPLSPRTKDGTTSQRKRQWHSSVHHVWLHIWVCWFHWLSMV